MRPTKPTKKKAFLGRERGMGGQVYWVIRSTVKPAQKVLCWLGRVPEDPHQRKVFMTRARLALLRYGIVAAIRGEIKT